MHVLEAAFVFGNLGNLSGALGAGWSVEDEFAWAIGTGESELTLQMPGNDLPYILRFDVHPAQFPPTITHQRLKVRAGKTELGSFEMKGRETIAIKLPLDLTRGHRHLHLGLLHPDAVRPSDFRPIADSRLLAFCFHSASLVLDRSDRPFADVPLASGGQHAVGQSAAKLEPVHGLIAGDATAQRICEVIGKLPSLKGRLGVRFLDLSRPLSQAEATLPAGTLETIRFCWTEINAGTTGTRDELRAAVPAGCAARTFYAPSCQALWPFQGVDSRSVPEPGRYHPSRFPYGDRVAQTLAGLRLSDEVIYLMYEVLTEKELLDLGAMFAADLRRWQADDQRSDLQLADFIVQHIRSDRVFISPGRVGPILLREMVLQMLDDPLVRDIARPEVLWAELDTLLDGFAGWREEIPIHPRVASHFGLSWWSADMQYRWKNNLRSHREYILDYIRWAQWRP
jgi:hypothetical protein